MRPTAAVPSSNRPVQASALTALRQATRERHQRIDRLMDPRRLPEPSRYARVLRTFAAFLGPWEAAVAAALPPPAQAWLGSRSRRPFLEQDLRTLGLAHPAPPGTRLRFHSPAAAWGSLYVMEGSALGGQVICRALAPAGLHAGNGAGYFHGWGDATAAMWQEFRGRLEAEVNDAAGTAQACAAACRTFDALTALLESELDERIALA